MCDIIKKTHILIIILYIFGYFKFFWKESDFLPFAGIIAEFNPLHSGHKYLIDRAKNDGYDVACVISGNFVQRGDVAIIPKFSRAEMALNAGVDVVLELPIPWAMSTAQNFALGGVSQLAAIGIDVLYFGSECGDLDKLFAVAEAIDSEIFKNKLSNRLSSGKTFACMRKEIIFETLGETALILDSPNDTLAVEYIIAAKKLNLDIGFKAIKRIGAHHNETVESAGFSTATLLRSAIMREDHEYLKNFMSKYDIKILRSSPIADIGRLDTAIMARLKQLDIQNISVLPDISEGLDNLLYNKIRDAYSYDSLCNAVKSKRYTLARIRRLILSAFLGIDNRFFLKEPPYVRVLGFAKAGKEHLIGCGRKPIVTRVSQMRQLDEFSASVFDTENRSNEVYALSLNEPSKFSSDLSQKILIK